MSPEEKNRMTADLEESRVALLNALQGATEDNATRRPAPGRWSVMECVEHLAVAEQYLLSQILSGQQGEPVPNAKREGRIRQYGADRSRPLQAPDGSTPAGRFTTLGGAHHNFLDRR